ncbi:MAG: hypothetical protein IPM81_03920 [Saprospirales bacterium]|nr:hypothetical protein [Saprospirales bacterium]
MACVKFFTSANIAGVSLPLDKSADVWLSIFSGPVSIVVEGQCEERCEKAKVHLIDYDATFLNKDDLLDEQEVPCKEGKFKATFSIWAGTGGIFSFTQIKGPLGSSDEDDPAIYVKNGNQQIPTGDHYWHFHVANEMVVGSGAKPKVRVRD